MFGTAATINSPEARVPAPSTLAFTLGGLLVGFGTKLSIGRASIRGVCRLGLRSACLLAAVLTFMSSAIATAYITSSEVAWSSMAQALRTSSNNSNASEPTTGFVFTSLFVAPTMLASTRLALRKDTAADGQQSKNSIAAISRSMFADGLAISQMVLKTKLYGFLDVVVGIEKGDWDPTLATVLTGTLLVSTVPYEFVKAHGMCNLSVAQERSCATLAPTPPNAISADASKDAPAAKVHVLSGKTIDGKLVAGAAMFGMGWGISLYCPGARAVPCSDRRHVDGVFLGTCRHRWGIRCTEAQGIQLASINGVRKGVVAVSSVACLQMGRPDYVVERGTMLSRMYDA